MNNRKNIENELKEVSPWLAEKLKAVPPKEDFITPSGYFDKMNDHFDERLQKKEFSLPKNYLDSLENEVIEKLKPRKFNIYPLLAIAASLGLIFYVVFGVNNNQGIESEIDFTEIEIPNDFLDDISMEELASLDIEDDFIVDDDFVIEDDETLAHFIEQNIDYYEEELLSELLINNYD